MMLQATYACGVQRFTAAPEPWVSSHDHTRSHPPAACKPALLPFVAVRPRGLSARRPRTCLVAKAASHAAAGDPAPAAGTAPAGPECCHPASPSQCTTTRNVAAGLSKEALLRVVLPTAVTLLVCNMDRICLSIAILPMSQEFGWSASLQGLIQSAFLWGYAATQLLGGSLADRYGGRTIMAAGVAAFSAASLLLPAALSGPFAAAGLTVPAILAARACVGLGEGVALPSMNNLVAAHIPPNAKSRALGMAFSGFHSGNLVGLILSPIILLQFGWRALFCSFGLVGIPLVAYWLATVPSTPLQQQQEQQPPQQQAADSSSSSSSTVSTWRLLSHPATWAIILVNFVNHWGYFIYLNWMPSYFVKALGFDLRASSFLALLPWLVMAVGSSAAGFLADHLIARGVPVTTVRKRLQTVAMLVPAAALLLLVQPWMTPAMAVAAMTTALGVTSLGQAGFVANMSDIAPKQAGQMFGLCNTFGCAAGILGVVAVGVVVEATGSFAPVFLLTAVMYVVAVIGWNLGCTGERVF